MCLFVLGAQLWVIKGGSASFTDPCGHCLPHPYGTSRCRGFAVFVQTNGVSRRSRARQKVTSSIRGFTVINQGPLPWSSNRG